MSPSSPFDFVFLPLGGVGEIGMNLGLYGYGPADDRSWLMVDCGVTFGNMEETPGVDLILPDIRFVQEDRHNLQAILITHAHEDHFGALITLWPRLRVPVYMTAFAAGLLRAKLAMERDPPRIDIKVIDQRARLELGPFDVEFVPVSHSIAEPCAVAVRTPAGTALHTGDWKIDAEPGVGEAIDLERFKEIGEEGVDALIADSTNAYREGVSPSEADIGASLREIMAAASHRVVVTTFSSQIARLRSVATAAAECGREVVVMGRAMQRAIDVASELGYFDGLPAFRDLNAFGHLPRDKVVALMTGSQGEQRAALAKISRDEHRDVALSPGDKVIFSSRTIPGNERAVNTIINALCDKGIDVITDRDALVHVSGHPRRGEMEQLYKLVKPRAVVPVHGEAMHLTRHEAFAHAIGITETASARNGTVVRLVPGPVEIIDEAFSGRLHKDGELLLEQSDEGVRERRKLAFAGAIVVIIVMGDKGEIAGECEVELLGLPEADAHDEPLIDLIGDAVDDAIASIPRGRRRNPEVVREAGRRAARSAAHRIWGKKPICRAVVVAPD